MLCGQTKVAEFNAYGVEHSSLRTQELLVWKGWYDLFLKQATNLEAAWLWS